MSEPKKFIDLFKPYYNDALRYTRSLCNGRNKDIGEDVLQQSLLQAIESFSQLKDESKFKVWLFTIITNVFYTTSKRYFWKKTLSLNDEDVKVDIPDVFNRYKQSEERLLLSEALSHLKEKDRAAILLFEIGNFSIEEIAEAQNERTVSAVKSRLSRARKKLKAQIVFLEKEKFLNSKNSQANFLNIENETSKLISEINKNK